MKHFNDRVTRNVVSNDPDQIHHIWDQIQEATQKNNWTIQEAWDINDGMEISTLTVAGFVNQVAKYFENK